MSQSCCLKKRGPEAPARELQAYGDIFPHIPRENPPGMVSYTATDWGQLMNPKKTPQNEKTPTAADCYRFVLTRPEVDVCMTGPSNAQQMDEALEALRQGPMSEAELAWMRRARPFTGSRGNPSSSRIATAVIPGRRLAEHLPSIYSVSVASH